LVIPEGHHVQLPSCPAAEEYLIHVLGQASFLEILPKGYALILLGFDHVSNILQILKLLKKRPILIHADNGHIGFAIPFHNELLAAILGARDDLSEDSADIRGSYSTGCLGHSFTPYVNHFKYSKPIFNTYRDPIAAMT